MSDATILFLGEPWEFSEVDEAADWLQAQKHRTYLFTHVMNEYGLRLDGQFSKRSDRRDRPGFRSGAALMCYCADYEMVSDALEMADGGGALVVVESHLTPTRGWARSVGALDFHSEEPLPPLTDAELELVKSLGFYGNNGFPPHDRPIAERLLRGALDDGILTRDVISAALLHGVSMQGAKRLDELVQKLIPGEYESGDRY